MKAIAIKLFLALSLVLNHARRVDQVDISAFKVDLSTAKDLTSPKVVFIAGYDEGDNTYYRQAKAYFQAHDFSVVDSLHSLVEILDWLNTRPKSLYFEEIHLVSHSNPWRGMSLKIRPGGERMTENALREAIVGHALPPLCRAIAPETRLIFHACGLGENRELLNLLKTAFSTDTAPLIYASPWYSVFGDGFAAHYLARTYYTYYPTGYTPGRYALTRELKNAYPGTPIDWLEALQTRQPFHPGQVYTYQYNVPIEWQLTFNQKERMPVFKNADDIMDWIVENDEMTEVLSAFQIPMEKFRWRSEAQGRTITIKGKTTIVCVLQPIMQAEDPMEYLVPDICNADLFITL